VESSWHIRLLSKVLGFIESLRREDPQTREYRDRVSKVIIGTIRALFHTDKNCYDTKDRAYRILTLIYGLRHLDTEQTEELKKPLRGTTYLFPFAEGTGEALPDSVTCLLHWCHLTLLKDRDVRKKLEIPDSYTPDPEYIHTFELGALLKSNQRTILRELESIAPENLRKGVLLEETWQQLALLQGELFISDTKTAPSFVSNLVEEVAKRLYARQIKKLGTYPPWGYRCLDHTLLIDLYNTNRRLGKPSEDLHEIIQSVYADCSLFLRSDHSFLKSWDSTETTWSSELWDFECTSLVSSAFLTCADLDWSPIERGSDTKQLAPQTAMETSVLGPKLHEIVEVLRDISHPERKQLGFPWREGLRVKYPYYPRFMYASSRTHQVSDGIEFMKKRILRLGYQKRSKHHLPKLLEKPRSLFPENPKEPNDPSEWTPEYLNREARGMCISDYPSDPDFGSDEISKFLTPSVCPYSFLKVSSYSYKL
jgi:hypothetical protein